MFKIVIKLNAKASNKHYECIHWGSVPYGCLMQFSQATNESNSKKATEPKV